MARYVLDLTTGQRPYTRPIVIKDDEGRTKVHVGLQYVDGLGTLLSFANNYPTVADGAHVAGFLAALTYVLRRLSRRGNPYERLFLPSSVTAQLAAVVSVWTPTPLFRGSTGAALYNPEVRRWVYEVAKSALLSYFDANAGELGRILAHLPLRIQ